ncbi:laminin subunit alpha-1-like [Paramacrobiotus metropolitanus]|uniref:laminin subunit alpha-1-like n=1 Tax=Paramacrobiotus metropolitanus TaxID=2943436 RepID=UPI0024458EE8|nr:laminin subunit alpha-1-like [Paramacrobiotus metropolitanus]
MKILGRITFPCCIIRTIAFLLIPVLFLSKSHGQIDAALQPRLEYMRFPFSNNEEEARGPLFPVILNLAANARATTNATCGLERPEVYCKLVEHVLMKPPQCGICDANSSDPAQRHTIENAIDGSPRWWQSPSVANGNVYEYITITIDLRQRYQVAYIIVKVANSPRPAAWELARSLDNITYHPWQYFARNDEECQELFGVPGTSGRKRFDSDDQVICSTDFSKIHPLEDGEIHTSLINDRTAGDGASKALTEFTVARYVRLRLVRLHTLTADLMRQINSKRVLDSSETRRYFYSIKDISIGGQCICSGHARDCPTDSEGVARCRCAHNTCGESCERCCPLFNQKPWKPGTVDDAAVCEGCQCHGHADECVYDYGVAQSRQSLSITGKYEGGGVCLDCQHNTTGLNCERCKDGFFRPLGVDKFNPIGCLPCECETAGIGTTGQCIANEEAMFGDLQPGDCVCLEGFGGPRCDHCAPGYRNYPRCEPCPCSYAGSKNGEACGDECICKDNVEGSRCERCKEGFFNLDAANPQGCSPCFCFGVTDVCQSVNGNVTKTVTLDGWILTDITGSRILYPTYLNGTPVIVADDSYELDVFYWLAPKEYRGNRLVSYGGKLDYSITFIKGRGDLTGSYTADVDVIMEGNGMRIGKGERFFRESTPHHLSVLLQEQGWNHVSLNGILSESVSKEIFMTVLANVEKLMIRGTYHTRQLESRLLMVAISQADRNAREGLRLTSVEECSCPAGYSGLSCETCTAGHRRVNSTLYNGICVPCQCYAHASHCDPSSGECRDCQHNTTGFFCETCASGYYGDAQSGDPEACKPCACPSLLSTNNFSPTCMTGKSLTLPDDYVCTNCPFGYVGAKCEMCADGYFGNPLVPGNFCQPCDCNGNIDSAALGNCERLSGKCLKCVGHTEGFNCERCETGYYGSALRHDCRACDCSPIGSEQTECDKYSGQCQCKPGYEGRKCDRCGRGFGRITEGCLPCDCDMTGSISSECDPISGQCQCLPGVFGVHCRRCQEGYYGFSASGCRPCGCEQTASVNQTCEQIHGQCHCQPNVVGRTCNRCVDGFWDITSGKGCVGCSCHSMGSVDPSCDPISGQCGCKAGVTGRRCSECQVGYYGLSANGCTKCPVCRAPGQVCDRVTGECVCPPHTVGERCERCGPYSYDYHPFLGCKPCNCSSVGAKSKECDVVTGDCQCLGRYEGKQCDKCELGWYGFPKCQECGCILSGTDMESCRDGKCGCKEENGQCSCRKNVIGRQCDQCKTGSFSLSMDTPDGCTTCFCSGRTNRCHQATLVWKSITHYGNKLDISFSDHIKNAPMNRTLAMDVVGFEAASTLLLPRQYPQTPCYWNLPHQFLGDKILAYNGKLRFKLSVEYSEETRKTRGTLSGFPLALLQGNNRIILDYKSHRENDRGSYEIHFHETKWTNRQSPHLPVTRELLMVALQNIQHLIIRGNTMPFPVHMEIRDVEMEVASPRNGPNDNGRMALGVEMCQCPLGYNGTSCQSPALGYFRKYALDFLDHPDHLKLLGEAAKCMCWNHSDQCNIENGRCIKCQRHTAGDHCERCAKGYYGDPKRSGSEPCKRCACPSLEHNYSESCTLFRNGDADDYLCDRCQVGFAGDKCDTCERGFYGNPKEGVPCTPCHCNLFGALNGHCHPVSGQCQCRGGLQGRDCGKCQAGHVITSAGCINCMHDSCIKTMMEEFGNMDYNLEIANSTDFSRAPLIRLARLQDRHDQLDIFVKSSLSPDGSLTSSFPQLELQFDLERDIRRVMLMANKSASEAIQAKSAGRQANKNIETVCMDVPLIEQKIRQLASTLLDYVRSEDSQGSLNVEVIVMEAENILANLANDTYKFNNVSAVGNWSVLQATLSEIEALESGGELVHAARRSFQEIRRKLEQLDKFLTEDTETAIRVARRMSATNARKIANINKNSQSFKAVNSSLAGVLEQSIRKKQEASNNYRNATRTFESLLLWDETTLNYSFPETFFGANQLSILSVVIRNDARTRIKDFRLALEKMNNNSGILALLNPEYKESLVGPALQHSEMLVDKADMLASLFEESKEATKNPIRAASVYATIINNIRQAQNDTAEAQLNADQVQAVVFPDDERELGVTAHQMINQSQELEETARELLEDSVSSLAEQLDEELGRLDGVNASNLRTALEMDKIGDRLFNLPMLGDEIAQLADNISDLSEAANKLLERADAVGTDVNVHLRPRFDQKGIDPVSLNRTAKIVKEVGSNVDYLSRNTTLLEGMTKTLDSLHRDMAGKIQRLRNLILSTKQAASSLQISLSHDANGMCRRSYEPPIIPSSANTITLTYSTSVPERNALLMYIGNPKSLALEPDFMAVEVFERRVRFVWNVGNDTKVIQHPPDQRSATESSLLQKDVWYKIEIIRVKNTAQLSVVPMSETQQSSPLLINGSSAAGFTRMDLNRSSEMFVGGLPNSVDVPEILSREFYGCLGGIAIDGQQIGLWNFKHTQGCTGCVTSASEGGGEVGAYTFNGGGYASVPQIRRYNNKRYSIFLTFRTFDENALLFLCANDKEPMGDFISLELRDGKVVFQFYLGGNNHLLVSTNRRFNTGNFVNVRAERHEFLADLRVDDDHIKASLPQVKPDGLELANRPVYFGGVPPGFVFQTRYNISHKPFIGCMKDIQIDVSTVDLLSRRVYHVDLEQGCRNRAIRDVSFSNSAGYLKLPGKTLPANASISFSFATGQADGLLIASVSKNYKRDHNYWTASIQGGRIVLTFSSGSAAKLKVIIDKSFYDDRVLHTVSIRKRKKKIEISVDDQVVQEEKVQIQGTDIISDIIYVGGVPSDVDLSSIAASARSFVGCITGLIISGELIGFEQLQAFDRAAIGRCEFEAAVPSTAEPLLTEPLPSAMALSRHPRNCAPSPKLIKTPVEWNAVSFGATKNSHVQMFLQRKDVKLFNFTGSFRNFHPNGVILYADNPTGKETLLLALRGGRMVLAVNDEYFQEAISQGDLSDGQWHTFHVERKSRRIILSVDDGRSEFVKLSKRFVVSVPFYIGGLDEKVITSTTMDRGGFQGCLGNLTWNGRSVNLFQEKALRGLGECYLNVQAAAYFEGNGYATLSDNFRANNRLLIEMEFRTNAMSGELLLFYDPIQRLYVQLKFIDSQVILNMSSPADSFHAMKAFPITGDRGAGLCDGQWHRLQALYLQNIITIDVDDSQHEYAYSRAQTPLLLPDNVPLYIGGRPASVPAHIIPKVANFVGCIRRLSLNNVAYGFHQMVTLNHVLLDSCPFS